jgi:hypothetical protein
MSEPPPPPPPPATDIPAPTHAERYHELQKLVMYADTLHISRYSVWLIAHYSLLAVVAAAFSSLPAKLIGVLAVVGVIVSLFWLMTAHSMSVRINWLNSELVKYGNSVHAEYLNSLSKDKSWLTRCKLSIRTTVILTWILPLLLSAAWVMIFVFKIW